MKKQRGITLIEVLIVLVLMTVGLLGILKFSFDMWYHSNLLKQETEALTLCQRKIEQLRSYEVISTTPSWTAYADITSSSETATGTNATYTTSWTVTTNSNPPYKTVTVTTSWTDSRATSQSVILSTIIAQLDPVVSGAIMTTTSGSL